MTEDSAKIKSVVDDILKDYDKGRDIDKMSVLHQPDKEAVTAIVNKLLRIIYPGYYRTNMFKTYNMDSNLNVWLEDVIYNLSKQIALVLQYQSESGSDKVVADCEASLRDDKSETLGNAGSTNNATYEEQNSNVTQEDIDARALCLAIEFCKKIPKIREYLDTDLEATLEGDPAASNKDEIILCYPGFLAVSINRIAHELFLLNVPLIPRMMTEYAHSITGIDIHPAATIGKYFFIDHGTGIVVGSTTIIGEHVKVYQGVTIGALSTSGGQSLRGVKRHPTIEDNVTIYSGASILGGETVLGHDSVIGSNAFITKSIPANSRVTIKNQQLSMKTEKDGVFVTME